MSNNKNIQEKNNKDPPIDKTKLKAYRVPDVHLKKYFEKINFYNFIGITKFFTFPEMLELAGVCHSFNQRIKEKYPKRIPLIQNTLKVLKKKYFFEIFRRFSIFIEKKQFLYFRINKKYGRKF